MPGAAPPKPRLTTPGCLPARRNKPTSQITSGVLPVPPTAMLPTTITGAATRTLRSAPARYSARRPHMMPPYKNPSGASATLKSESPYHSSSVRIYITAATAASGTGHLHAGLRIEGKLQLMQLGVVAAASDPREVGDEPVLIALRAGCP